MTHRESTYGYYLGGDPRKFTPDEECNTPEEIEAWKAACEAWERGEKVDPGGACQWVPGLGHVTVTRYGLGITEFEEECEGPGCYWCENAPAVGAVEP